LNFSGPEIFCGSKKVFFYCQKNFLNDFLEPTAADSFVDYIMQEQASLVNY
jgi:hypothetical protein